MRRAILFCSILGLCSCRLFGGATHVPTQAPAACVCQCSSPTTHQEREPMEGISIETDTPKKK